MRSNSSTDDRGRLLYAVAFIALAVFAVFLIATAVNTADDSDAYVDEQFIVDDIKYVVKEESGSTGTVSVMMKIESTTINTYTGDVIIPETVVNNSITYTVVSLESQAFYNCRNLDTLVIPKTVTTLGQTCLHSPTLTDVIIRGDSCTWAITGCTCYKITKIHVPSDVLDNYKADVKWKYMKDQIVGYTEYKDSADNEICVMNDMMIIDKGSAGSGVMEDFSITANLITRYNIQETFSKLFICSGMTSIGNCAFHGCTNIRSITMVDSVTSIGSDAFNGCSSITTVPLSNSLTAIGGGAFKLCTSLTSVMIPSTVTSIGDSAFHGCPLLIGSSTNIHIHMMNSTPATLGSTAFPDNSYIDVPNGSLTAYQAVTEWAAFNLNEAGDSSTKVKITFDACGGTGGPSPLNFEYGKSKYGSKITVPTVGYKSSLEGYRFAGYYEAANGQGKMYFSYNGTFVTTWDKTSDTILYAYWVPYKTNITFQSIISSGVYQYGSAIATYGSGLSKFVGVPDFPGHSLVGYFFNSSDTMLVSANGTLQSNVTVGPTRYTDASGNWAPTNYNQTQVVVYARWTLTTYTISLPDPSDRVGYTIESSCTTLTYDDTCTITLTLLDGYKGSSPIVRSNDAVLTPVISANVYTYTLTKTAANLVITVGSVTVDVPVITVTGATGSAGTYTADYTKEGVTLSVSGYPNGTTYVWYFGDETVGTSSSCVAWGTASSGSYKVSVTLNSETKTSEVISLTINAVALTITANDKTITYGDAVSNNGVSYNGFATGEDESVLVGTLSYTYDYDTSDPLKRGVGTYYIRPSGLSSVNYDITFIDGDLTVEGAQLIVLAQSKTITYGNPAPEYNIAYTGLKYDDLSVVIPDFSITCPYDVSTPATRTVGTYVITPSGTSTAGNYAVTYLTGTLTVNKEEFAIWDQLYEQYTGNASYYVSGYTTGIYDDLLDLTYTPSSKNVGTYVYNAPSNGFTLTYEGYQNYEITHVEDLIISKRTISILGWNAPADLVYSGTAKEPVAIFDEVNPLDVCKAIGTFNGDNVNVGTFSMTATGVTNSNYELIAESTSNQYAILKATPAAIHFNVILPEDLTYDGNEKVADVKLKDGLTGMGVITVSYSDNVNVGTCKIFVTVTEGTNFTAAENVEVGSFEITEKPSSGGLSTGAIIGIVAGVIVALGAIAAVVIIYLRKNFYI